MNRLLLLTTLVGCSSGNITTTELDAALSQYDGMPSEETVKPRNGDWSYTSVDIASDTCSNLIDMLDIGSGFEVERLGTSFTMRLDGGDDADCTVGGDLFDCAAVSDSVNSQDAVTLRTSMDTRGVLYSPDAMEGVHEVNLSCDGAGCALLEVARDVNFPCTFGVFYTAATQ
ncbi:MAG: hypothetical protein P8R54_27725 [Myxococcota bacterium]|nr:hypothetical protein [Myxococcota bacterium]